MKAPFAGPPRGRPGGREHRWRHAAPRCARRGRRSPYQALRRYPPAGEKTWTRTNHRGEPLTLLEGPAVAAGAVAAQVIAAAVAARRGTRQMRRR